MKTNAKCLLLAVGCLLLAGCHDRHRPKAHKSRTHKSTAADTCYDGFYVSQHQGNIDWAAAAAGTSARYVYIKATEGARHRDGKYARYVREARKNGFLIGSYHYFRMTSSAHAQFDNIRSTSASKTRTWSR